MNIKAVVFDLGRVFLFPKDNGYTGSLNELHRVLSASPNYDFSRQFVLNTELLNFMKEKKTQKGIETYLFTKGKLKEVPECKRFWGGFFKEIYVSDSAKLKKNDPRSYKFLSENLPYSASEILYVDDKRENTLAAEQAGLLSITYRNNMQFETEFEGYV